MLNNHLVFIHIGFSLVEAIFGTEGLQVLTAAKTVIDPSNIFTCDYCVRALPVSILCLYKLYPHFKVLLDSSYTSLYTCSNPHMFLPTIKSPSTSLKDKLHETVIGADKCSKHGSESLMMCEDY